MTKDQADELKRLVARVNVLATRVVMPQYVNAVKELDAAIDSLTQQPAELTDAKLCEIFNKYGIDSRDHRSVVRCFRAVIAAHKEKQVKV